MTLPGFRSEQWGGRLQFSKVEKATVIVDLGAKINGTA